MDRPDPKTATFLQIHDYAKYSQEGFAWLSQSIRQANIFERYVADLVIERDRLRAELVAERKRHSAPYISGPFDIGGDFDKGDDGS